MTSHARSSRWAAALGLGLVSLIGTGAATVSAGPVTRAAANAFELTLDTTMEETEFSFTVENTFSSRAPFCATGTFEQVEGVPGGMGWKREAVRFTCDNGTGSLTILVRITTWKILAGSGSYTDLRGTGWVRGEPGKFSGPRLTFRSTLGGVADRDTVAPTIAFSSATATKLPRPAGTYVLKLGMVLRDNVADNPVSYTLRASARGAELARRIGTARTGAVSMTLRIRPHAGARTIRLALSGSDPVGNATSVRRVSNLPR